eukprot:CAMPEP_0119331242 /NCGR_PEP_ID=MMETSP1333-20130426/80188_1 /TAXON_ID=418940 /ORGANISM="Scyphosphaera apsteinii, Strain RCC1455" /LENGTH=50 /DNA_ID=CAMNT_0007340799 /DNA_START=147 /DNA_END=296 /DNA_ORIENTATION=+
MGTTWALHGGECASVDGVSSTRDMSMRIGACDGTAYTCAAVLIIALAFVT